MLECYKEKLGPRQHFARCHGDSKSPSKKLLVDKGARQGQNSLACSSKHVTEMKASGFGVR